MKRSIAPVRGPAKKSRNWFLNFTAVAALVVVALPASAQSIVVTGTDAPAVQNTPVAAPRSIIEPYKAAPRSRAPLSLLIAEPQSPQTVAATTGNPANQIVADQVASAPTRSLPTITVSTLSVPSTARN